MSSRMLEVRGRQVDLLEAGSGEPVLYLHDMWDLHGAQAGMFPFHEELATTFRLLAPAHPGCGESKGVSDMLDIEDLAFHYFDLLDSLGLRSATVLGVGLGGWIAAEMAVRNPERIGRMALVGAAGLQDPEALIADVFMYSQHRDGGIMRELRDILFRDAESEVARAIVPDGRVSVPDEVRRYKSLTIAGRVGWEPPYLHNRRLAARLHRVSCPTLLLWGEHDRFVPLTNAHTYRQNLPQSALVALAGSGHSVLIEQPRESLDILVPFLATGILPSPG